MELAECLDLSLGDLPRASSACTRNNRHLKPATLTQIAHLNDLRGSI